MSSDDERIAKLPLWAREHIFQLERTLSRALKQLEDISGPPSNTYWRRYQSPLPLGPAYLPDYEAVTFAIGPGRFDTVTARVTEDAYAGGRTITALSVRGDRPVNIVPMSSSGIYVTLEPTNA